MSVFLFLMENEGRELPLKGNCRTLKCYNEEDHIRTSNVPILLSGNNVDMNVLGSKLRASHYFLNICS